MSIDDIIQTKFDEIKSIYNSQIEALKREIEKYVLPQLVNYIIFNKFL